MFRHARLDHAGEGRSGRLLAGLLSVLCLLSPQTALARNAYVDNGGGNSVTPISTATNTAGTPITVGTNPVAIAITPNGKTAYVVNSTASGTVTPISTATNTAGMPITVGINPEGIAITPDGTTAYVVNDSNNNVTPIDTATNTAGAPITVGSHPDGVAITPDGKTAYVVNINDNSVTPIVTATDTSGTPITVGSIPQMVAITPDGKTAYVTNSGGGSVTPINTATNTAGAAITVGSVPQAVAITADGKTAYVAKLDGTVTPINIATDTAGTPITVGGDPDAIAVAPDGRTAYVVNNNNSVTPITTATNTAGTPITVGTHPDAIAVTPDQPPIAAFSTSAITAGVPSGFDASLSTDPDGSVASYAWDFGDGSTLTTPSPSTSHVYAAPGSYTARLMLTDSEGCSTALVFTGQTAFCNGAATASTTRQVTVTAAPVPNSSFSTLRTIVNHKTGAITFTELVRDPGTFKWSLSFRNGKFGIFRATNRTTCQTGKVKLVGKCRLARIGFGSGRKTVATVGIVTFTVKPSSSATKALKQARKHKRGVGITALLSYQSARGGSPVSHTVPVTDKLTRIRKKPTARSSR